MDKEIIIKTTEAGINLHHSYFDNVDLYTDHIDQLNKWHISVNTLENLKPKEDVADKCKSLKSLISLDSLLCIAITDLGLIVKELFVSSVALQRSFYIKHAYLVVYETIYNFNSSSDKRKVLKDLIAKLVNPALTKIFEEVTIGLRDFNKNFGMETDIANVRNTLSGHIDKDFSRWYSTVIALDGEHTGKMVTEFLRVISPLQQLSRTLLQIEMRELDKINNRVSNEFENTLLKIEELFDKVNKDIEDKDQHFDINLLKNIFKP